MLHDAFVVVGQNRRQRDDLPSRSQIGRHRLSVVIRMYIELRSRKPYCSVAHALIHQGLHSLNLIIARRPLARLRTHDPATNR